MLLLVIAAEINTVRLALTDTSRYVATFPGATGRSGHRRRRAQSHGRLSANRHAHDLSGHVAIVYGVAARGGEQRAVRRKSRLPLDRAYRALWTTECATPASVPDVTVNVLLVANFVKPSSRNSRN